MPTATVETVSHGGLRVSEVRVTAENRVHAFCLGKRASVWLLVNSMPG